EKRIQRRLEAIVPAQVVHLKKVYASIRDGMSTAEEWFDMEPQQGQGASAPEAAERPAYPADQFAKNLPGWQKLIADGKKTVEQIVAMAQSKGLLSADQIAAIKGAPA